MKRNEIHTCTGSIEYIDRFGFLPLLPTGIPEWPAEEVVDVECRYTPLPKGGWKWPLWKWKGGNIQECGCAYGKFFRGEYHVREQTDGCQIPCWS